MCLQFYYWAVVGRPPASEGGASLVLRGWTQWPDTSGHCVPASAPVLHFNPYSTVDITATIYNGQPSSLYNTVDSQLHSTVDTTASLYNPLNKYSHIQLRLTQGLSATIYNGQPSTLYNGQPSTLYNGQPSTASLHQSTAYPPGLPSPLPRITPADVSHPTPSR